MNKIQYIGVGVMMILVLVVGYLFRFNLALKANNFDLITNLKKITDERNDSLRNWGEIKDKLIEWEDLTMVDGSELSDLTQRGCLKLQDIQSVFKDDICGLTEDGSLTIRVERDGEGYILKVQLISTSFESRSLIPNTILARKYNTFIVHGTTDNKWIIYSLGTRDEMRTYVANIEDTASEFNRPRLVERCVLGRAYLTMFFRTCKSIVDNKQSKYSEFIVNKGLFESR